MRENKPLNMLQNFGFRFPTRIVVTGLFCSLAILGLIIALPLNAFELAGGPVLDLNGPEIQGSDYATTFTEDEGPLMIVAESLTLEADTTHMTSATISLQDFPDKSQESLSADMSGTNITSTYSPATGVLQLTGWYPVKDYETVLKTVTYLNESQAPDTTDRNVTFVVKDGSSTNSEPVSSTVAILAVNDAPVLDNTGDMHLDPIVEDDQSQIGNLVSTIISSAEASGQDRITDPDDPDGTDPEGFAVIEVGDSNGTWEYSTDSGSTWFSFGTVNNNSAVLLDETSRIRFVPNANYSGIASFIFRAWDQTTEETSGERADASIIGETSAFSIATESVTIDVTAVNDRPVVDLNGQLPGEEYAASFLSDNEPVPLTTLDAFVFDVESSELVSLIITLTNRPDGSKESITVKEARGGIKLTAYDPATGILKLEGAASLSDYSIMLQGIRYLNEAINMNTDARIIEFIANDGTDNSLLRSTTLVSVLTNIAPVLDPSAAMHFTDIDEDDTDPEGDAISAVLATADSDPIHDDDPDALHGFAIVGAENENGAWQFSIDDGTTWLVVGEVSDTAAVLLNEQAKIRFLPDPNFSGEARSLTVRAWDQTEGSNGLSSVDVSNNGGITPFSVDSSSIPVTIKAINDAPTLIITENTIAQHTEGNGPVVVAGPAIQIIDVDSDMLQSAAVSISNMIPNEPDVLATITNGSGIVASFDEGTGTLNLIGKGTLADYQSVLRSVTFDNLSQDPEVDDRIISFNVHDGADSSNDVTSTVRVEAVNDVPLLDLNGDSSSGINNFVYYDKDGTNGGGSVPLANTLLIHDVDNTTLIGATVLLKNRPDGLSESLTIDTSGTNISATYEDSGKQINLSGLDSLAAYQKVLRTGIYSNKLSIPNRAVRDILFTVQDASLGFSTAIAKVVIRPQFVFFPVITNHTAQQLVEEPNDNCQQAVSISTNVNYEFLADDVNDWFSFTLARSATTRVELTEFGPKDGQILVAKGNCGDLKLIDHNGDYSTAKIIKLEDLEAGRYYIWLINDGPTNIQDPYKLQVKTN